MCNVSTAEGVLCLHEQQWEAEALELFEGPSGFSLPFFFLVWVCFFFGGGGEGLLGFFVCLFVPPDSPVVCREGLTGLAADRPSSQCPLFSLLTLSGWGGGQS